MDRKKPSCMFQGGDERGLIRFTAAVMLRKSTNIHLDHDFLA